MLLAGPLSNTTLGDILGQLHRARATGVLTLEETRPTPTKHAIHVVAGRPRAVASRGPRLGEVIGRKEPTKVARSDAADASAQWDQPSHGDRVEQALRMQQAGDPRLLGELLRELGVSAVRVEESLHAQTRDRLEPLYRLPEARVAFHAALFDDVVPRSWVRAARAARGLSPSEFLYGRPRARSRSECLESERSEALRLLGVRSDDDPGTVRNAYRRRVLELHPDRVKSEEEKLVRTRALARLTAAYHRLTS